MIESPVFDPVRDVQEVVPGMSIDISEAVRTGVVGNTSGESLYNELDEIRKIGKRIRDNFDALEASSQLVNQIESASVNPEGSETV